MARRTVIVLLAAAALASACSGGSSRGGAAPRGSGDGAPADAKPALARAAQRSGEVLVEGQASPASHGPFTLRGRYVVRFEQIAPEDPKLDFASQTPFVVTLDRKAEQEGPGSVRLFRKAAHAGRKEMRLSGRYFIDVSFGDFPYAVRLTPTDRR